MRRMGHRTLPVITFEGTPFFVDVMNNEFKERDDASNTIPFGAMFYLRDHYLMQYDPTTKNYVRHDRYNHPDIKNIQIPSLTQLDIETLALKYGLKAEDLQDKRDFEIIVDQRVFLDRLKGKLPQIEIQGHVFDVDVETEMLRSKEDHTANPIRFTDMRGDGLYVSQSYRFYYDTQLHQQVEPDIETIIELPKNVVQVEIPSLERLDPYGYAKLKGFSIEDHLIRCPPQARLKVVPLPWRASALPTFIAHNRKKLGLPELPEQKQAKKGKSL
jgi:hypothetical protein